MVNTKPEQAEEESEEVREQKHKTFVEKYEKQIKHFGEPRGWAWARAAGLQLGGGHPGVPACMPSLHPTLGYLCRYAPPLG